MHLINKLIYNILFLLIYRQNSMEFPSSSQTIPKHSDLPYLDLCAPLKKYFSQEGVDLLDEIPKSPFPAQSNVCSHQISCCSNFIEKIITAKQIMKLEINLKEIVSGLHQEFHKNSVNLHRTVIKSIVESGLNLNAVFNKTYGMVYWQNSDLFYTLFSRLRTYVASASSPYKPTMGPKAALDSFFLDLYERTFCLLNAQYRFDSPYRSCLRSTYDIIKPFSSTNGDDPAKQASRLTTSLTLTHSLLFALARLSYNILEYPVQKTTTSSIVHYNQDNPFWISKILVSDETAKKVLMTLWGCPLCQPNPNPNASYTPCPKLCETILSISVRHFAKLSNRWGLYINAILDILKRLQGSFSLEANINTLDVKISEAIMNFQERSITFSNKVYKICGQPPLKSYDSVNDQVFQNSLKPDWRKLVVDDNKEFFKGVQKEYKTNSILSDISSLTENARHFWEDLNSTLIIKLCPVFVHSQKLTSLNHINPSPTEKEESICWNGQNYNASNHYNVSSLPAITSNLNLTVMKGIESSIDKLTQILVKTYKGTSVYIVDDEDEQLPPKQFVISDSKLDLSLDNSGSGMHILEENLYSTIDPTSRQNHSLGYAKHIPLVTLQGDLEQPKLFHDDDTTPQEGSGIIESNLLAKKNTSYVMFISTIEPKIITSVTPVILNHHPIDVIITKNTVYGKIDNDDQDASDSSNRGNVLSENGKISERDPGTIVYRFGLTVFMLGVVFVP